MTSVTAAVGVDGTRRCSIRTGQNSVDWRLEQIAERCRRLLGAGQGHFEALKMGSDQLVAYPRIGRGDDSVDLFEGHVQRPESPDHLGGRYLIGGVVAVSGEGVNLSRFEQADAVVVAQRLDVQVSRSGEVPDGQC
jgi:hypothetical protein